VSDDLWGDSSEDVGAELTPKRRAFLEACEKDPSLYFWGKDPETDIAIVRTKDTHDERNPIKPLPEWEYLAFLLAQFYTNLKVVVDKPRQMMCSWVALLWLDWNCLFKPYRTCLLNKSTQQEAETMLLGRLGVVHKFWPQWFAEWAQVKEVRATPAGYEYGRTGSVITATGENVDDRAGRGDQASIFVVDESARHPRLREVMAAIAPMARQIILISTPELGTPGAQYMAELLAEGRDTA
jgi:hypothetical protein